MSLVKLRNDGQAILFVDSLSLTIRPNEVKLLDEDTATNDAQLMQCVLSGIVKMCAMNGDFEEESSKEVVEEPAQPEIDPQPSPQPEAEMNQQVATDEQVRAAKEEAARKIQEHGKEFEPKNTTPVVMFGEKPSRQKTTSQTEMAMPDYISPDEIIGTDELPDDPLADEDAPDDIVFADKDSPIDEGHEGMIDARE